MTPDGSEMQRLASLFDEAARLHGDDWQAVHAHVRDAVSRMPAETQDRLSGEIDRLLRFTPPQAVPDRHH